MPNQLVADRLFHALGDPTRLAVVERLTVAPATVSALAAPHSMALPSFLQHLEVLERAGWITSEKRGRVRTCRLNPGALAQSSDWLQARRTMWEKRLDQLDALLLELANEDQPREEGAVP
ncbi:MAG: ArsR/SmtB family transcription factor [Dehalococcoidia bacterium]